MNKSKLGFWIVNAGVCLLSAAAFARETPFDKMQLKGRTDKENPVAYKVGEPIVFTLRTDGLDAVPTNDRYRVRWERTGDDGKVEKGEMLFPRLDIDKELEELDAISKSLKA